MSPHYGLHCLGEHLPRAIQIPGHAPLVEFDFIQARHQRL